MRRADRIARARAGGLWSEPVQAMQHDRFQQFSSGFRQQKRLASAALLSSRRLPFSAFECRCQNEGARYSRLVHKVRRKDRESMRNVCELRLSMRVFGAAKAAPRRAPAATAGRRNFSSGQRLATEEYG
jgi:hypothetical protein